MKKVIIAMLTLLFLVSCGKQNSTDIINPEAEYRYFFWATCPHCQELNRIAESRDLYSQISIEKREVYHNAENRQIFIDLVAELEPESDGVPFVYDTITGEVAVGVRPALELMTSRLGQNSNNQEEVTATTWPESLEQEEISGENNDNQQ